VDKKLLSLLAIVVLTLVAMSAVPPSYARVEDEIYIIGVVEPLNKTQLPGHVDFPFYGEIMQEVLSSPANNYIIKILDKQDLAEAGYYFSSIKNDSDLQTAQIRKLCENNRLDAILTGKITDLDRKIVPRLFDDMGREMVFAMEGLLYDRDGRKLWSDSVSVKYEFTRDEGEFKPPVYTQMVNLFVKNTRELAASLIDRIGTKPIDREPPTIEFENIRSGDKIKTTCIILKGKVADNSKVDLITVNGQKFPLKMPQKEVEMFYPVKIPHGVKGQRVLITIEAQDIYGFKYAKELNLTWATPIKGIVTSVNPDTLSVGFSWSDFKRTPIGTGFWLYSVDEFRDPLSSHRMRMFTVEEIGPVVVVKRFPQKGVVHVKFFKNQDGLKERAKKDDIVK